MSSRTMKNLRISQFPHPENNPPQRLPRPRRQCLLPPHQKFSMVWKLLKCVTTMRLTPQVQMQFFVCVYSNVTQCHVTCIDCISFFFLDWLAGIQVIEALVDFMVVNDGGQRLPGRDKYRRIMSTLTQVKLTMTPTLTFLVFLFWSGVISFISTDFHGTRGKHHRRPAHQSASRRSSASNTVSERFWQQYCVVWSVRRRTEEADAETKAQVHASWLGRKQRARQRPLGCGTASSGVGRLWRLWTTWWGDGGGRRSRRTAPASRQLRCRWQCSAVWLSVVGQYIRNRLKGTKLWAKLTTVPNN